MRFEIKISSLLVISLVFSMLFAHLVIFICDISGIIEILQSPTTGNIGHELFARLFLFSFMMILLSPFAIYRSARNWLSSHLWCLIILVLFIFGAATGMVDPFHGLKAEENWIRYWTSGVLIVAGLVSLTSSLRRQFAVLDRAFGCLFGLLLLVAGADELYEFHEKIGQDMDDWLSLNSSLTGQDILTLSFGIAGMLVLILATVIWRRLSWAKTRFRESRYRRSFYLLASAVTTFSSAMVLDTFDLYIEQFVQDLRLKILDIPAAGEVPFWLQIADIGRAANGLEELLEYFAALLLLIVIGTMFSIRAMSYDKPLVEAQAHSRRIPGRSL